jgi:hypothetical protein
MANGGFLSDNGENWLAFMNPKQVQAGKAQDRPDLIPSAKLLKMVHHPPVGVTGTENLKTLFREFSVSQYYVDGRYGQ